MSINLILASASPQRKKLLRKAGFRFKIVPSHIEEPDAGRVSHTKARRLVMELAEKKAKEIALRLRNENCAVLGADTVVVCGGKIFGKPKNPAHARKMLQTLSNQWQTVVTGLCLIKNPGAKISSAYAETRILFHKLDQKTITRLAQKNLDKSGSYAIQKMNGRLIKQIKGDLDNVIGLPIRAFSRLLKRMKINFK